MAPVAQPIKWDPNQERHLLQAINNMTKAVNRCALAIEKLNKAGEESSGSPEQERTDEESGS